MSLSDKNCLRRCAATQTIKQSICKMPEWSAAPGPTPHRRYWIFESCMGRFWTLARVGEAAFGPSNSAGAVEFERGRHFHLGQYDAATRDCHQALEINPYHFQAAAVMGEAYEMQHNLVAALESFRRALRLNPNMEEVRARVIQLQRALKNQ